ncbi:MAG: superoxide dismutase [Candidatus Woesebacteria bacterium]|nr:MAG: superoxide dismutase [Candidatus Woesebacteria bacterium]
MFTLPDLPYAYSSLEPFIDEETMHVHHDKHHASYVKNLNDLLTGHEDLLNMDVNDLLVDLRKVPEDIRQKVKNNAGGVANHNMFWTIMSGNPTTEARSPSGSLKNEIEKTFGSFEAFQEKFSAMALGHFGSGWAWVVVNKSKNMSLEIVDTTNQDSPFSISSMYTPILCLDVWEHAYYLKYKNMRADYIEAWWNVVNWTEVDKRFQSVALNK